MIKMKAHIALLVMALFCAKTRGQQCYECLSITTDSDGLDLPITEVGFESCDGPLKIVDCSIAGGCLKADYMINYDVTGTGRVGVGLVVRTCGAAVDYCHSDSELQQAIAAQRESLNSMLPTDVEFVSASGNACICTGSLCNGAPVWKISFAFMLFSLLVSYVATNR